MKKQAADQSFHDRRYQERKRAEAARKPVKKKAGAGGVGEKQVPFDSPSPIGSGSLRAGSHFVRNDKSLGGDGGETKVPRFARDDKGEGRGKRDGEGQSENQ